MAVDYTPSFDPADVDSDYGSTGGDITVPTFTANMKPFRFWCQRALPLVYDDSLSYYEVLCKVVDQLNGFLTDLQTATGSIEEFAEQFVTNQTFLNNMAAQLGQDVDSLETYINDRMDDFTTAYEQLQSYVNTYFDNLDVQQEINNKLDAMAANGTFNTLFDPVITAWMTAKTAQIDSAISNQDAIQAQQNARISVLEGRMDGFSSLPSGSTSGNAELLDIRTNFLGENYPTAGDAVRASDMIVSGFQSIGFTRLTDWNGNGESSIYDTIVIDVAAYKGGHVVVIANMDSFEQSIQDGIGIGLYGSNVAEKTVDANATPYPFPDGFSGLSSPVFKNYTIISTSIQGEERVLIQLSIPSDFTFQYLKLGNVEFAGSGEHTTPLAIVYATSWSKTPVDNTLSIAGDAADAKATGDLITANSNTIKTVQESIYNFLTSDKAPADRTTWANKRVTADGLVYSPSQLTSEDILYIGKNNIIRVEANSYKRQISVSYYTETNGELVYVQSDIFRINYLKFISAKYDFIRISYVGTSQDPPQLAEFTLSFIKVLHNEYLGKNISFLGDSITTYTNISETNANYNAPYYPTGDISYPEQCYWKMFFDAVSGANLSISAISNSSYRNQGNAQVPGAYDTVRINRLAVNGTPDFVFINMGTNDPYSSNIGDAIGYTYDTEALEENVVYTSYAIQATIRKIQETYPNAKIILLIPKFASAINTGDYTFEKWEKVCDYIVSIGNMYGVYKIVDMRKCGITKDTMATDCIAGGMHPNYTGMKKMGNYLIEALLR